MALAILFNRKYFQFSILLLFAAIEVTSSYAQALSDNQFRPIAHRGGVVDSNTAENSKQSILGAIELGYWAVELDLRATKDKELIIHHDRTFSRYYGVDSLVHAMNWADIARLKSATGDGVVSFEDALKLCQGKIQVMVDNKIEGNDTILFSRVINLLRKYDLLDSSLMIGTSASTAFFTGKIRLSCTRSQLESNMKKPGYKPENYYLFSASITRDDFTWAANNKIMAVGVLNRWANRNADEDTIRTLANQLKSSGTRYFQIDNEFFELFR